MMVQHDHIDLVELVERKTKVRRIRQVEIEPVACRYCNSRLVKDCIGCQVV